MHDNNSELQTIEYQRPSQIQQEELISFISLPHYELHKLVNDSCIIIAYLRGLSDKNQQTEQWCQIKNITQSFQGSFDITEWSLENFIICSGLWKEHWSGPHSLCSSQFGLHLQKFVDNAQMLHLHRRFVYCNFRFDFQPRQSSSLIAKFDIMCTDQLKFIWKDFNLWN